jgi:hypothetical protein
MRTLSDTWTLAKRSLRHVTRSPDTVITVLLMPIALMLLFVYVWGGAFTVGQWHGRPRGLDGPSMDPRSSRRLVSSIRGSLQAQSDRGERLGRDMDGRAPEPAWKVRELLVRFTMSSP